MWKDLTLRQRALLIQMGVRAGIGSANTIRKLYDLQNTFAVGGVKPKILVSGTFADSETGDYRHPIEAARQKLFPYYKDYVASLNKSGDPLDDAALYYNFHQMMLDAFDDLERAYGNKFNDMTDMQLAALLSAYFQGKKEGRNIVGKGSPFYWSYMLGSPVYDYIKASTGPENALRKMWWEYKDTHPFTVDKEGYNRFGEAMSFNLPEAVIEAPKKTAPTTPTPPIDWEYNEEVVGMPPLQEKQKEENEKPILKKVVRERMPGFDPEALYTNFGDRDNHRYKTFKYELDPDKVIMDNKALELRNLETVGFLQRMLDIYSPVEDEFYVNPMLKNAYGGNLFKGGGYTDDEPTMYGSTKEDAVITGHKNISGWKRFWNKNFRSKDGWNRYIDRQYAKMQHAQDAVNDVVNRDNTYEVTDALSNLGNIQRVSYQEDIDREKTWNVYNNWKEHSEIIGPHFDPDGNFHDDSYRNPSAGYLSNADPVAEFYVTGEALGPLFKLAGKGINYLKNFGQKAGNTDNVLLASLDNKLATKPPALKAIKASQAAENDIKLMNKYHTDNVAEYNTSTNSNIKNVPFRENIVGSQTKVLPKEEFENIIKGKKTNSPTGNIENIGGLYDRSEDITYLKQTGSPSTAYHEFLHRGKYGITNPEVTKWRIEQLVDPEAIKGMSEASKSYYLSEAEFPVHLRQLGESYGIKVGQEFPGEAVFNKILENNGVGGAGFYAKGNRITSPLADKELFWRALNGTLFGAVPVTFGLFQMNNDQKAYGGNLFAYGGNEPDWHKLYKGVSYNTDLNSIDKDPLYSIDSTGKVIYPQYEEWSNGNPRDAVAPAYMSADYNTPLTFGQIYDNLKSVYDLYNARIDAENRRKNPLLIDYYLNHARTDIGLRPIGMGSEYTDGIERAIRDYIPYSFNKGVEVLTLPLRLAIDGMLAQPNSVGGTSYSAANPNQYAVYTEPNPEASNNVNTLMSYAMPSTWAKKILPDEAVDLLDNTEWGNAATNAFDLWSIGKVKNIPYGLKLTIDYGLTKLGSNMAKGRYVSRAIGHNVNNTSPKINNELKPEIRFKLGDVEMNDPNLMYHLDMGDNVGAFNHTNGAYIKNGNLIPGSAFDMQQQNYSWWNLGKPYAMGINGNQFTRLVTAHKGNPNFLHVRSLNYPIGQWNGNRGFVTNSEYVSMNPVDVAQSQYIWDPNYGYRKLTSTNKSFILNGPTTIDASVDIPYLSAMANNDFKTALILRNLHYMDNTLNPLIGNNGRPLNLYHGSKSKFRVFNPNSGVQRSKGGSNGTIFTTPDRRSALEYAGSQRDMDQGRGFLYKLYGNPGNNLRVLDFEGRRWDGEAWTFSYKDPVTGENTYMLNSVGKKYHSTPFPPANMTINPETGELTYDINGLLIPYGEASVNPLLFKTINSTALEAGLLKDNGYTSGLFKNVDEMNGGEYLIDDFVFTSPNQVKLADWATYTEDGQLIPLSRRDDWMNPDINFRYGGYLI